MQCTPRQSFKHRHLLSSGVTMDVLGIADSEPSDADREAIVAAHPRTEHFKEDIIQTFYDGIKHKPESCEAATSKLDQSGLSRCPDQSASASLPDRL